MILKQKVMFELELEPDLYQRNFEPGSVHGSAILGIGHPQKMPFELANFP